MATQLGELQLIPTFHSVSIYSKFQSDSVGDNISKLEWRRAGELSWKPGMDVSSGWTLDRRAQIWVRESYEVNPYVNQWRGSLLGCQENTEYEVRVTYADPEGIIGSDFHAASIRTKNSNIPLGTGGFYYVDIVNGNDSNPGTETLPFQTLSKAAIVARPGDTVIIRAGLYVEPFAIRVSGQLNNYITWQPYVQEEVIIDGNNTTQVVLLEASYNKIRGLRIRNANRFGVHLQNGASFNVIEDNRIEDYGYTVPDAGVSIYSDAGYNLVQRNYITSARTAGPDKLHQENGVSIWGTLDNKGPKEGNVVRYNTIVGGVPGNSISDGVGGNLNSWIKDGPYKDCDIYENVIRDTADDGLEIEGGNINVRVWGNKILNPLTSGMAHVQVIVGPLYIFRNELWQIARHGYYFKVASSKPRTGRAYIFHNSCWGIQQREKFAQDAGSYGGFSYYYNHTYRNNAFRGQRRGIAHSGGDSPIGTGAGTTFDYNDFYVTGYEGERIHTFEGVQYFTFADWQAGGHDLHGIYADPLFVDPAGMDLRLQPSSPCIDRGCILFGFNDPDSAWPYGGAAPDIGALEYGAPVAAPIAKFKAVPASGAAPLSVQFTDESLGMITSWLWDFGDGTTSTDRNPNHTYAVMGNYLAHLTVGGPGGTATAELTIQVTAPLVTHVLSIVAALGGTTDPAPGDYPVTEGQTVTITAIPSSGYSFLRWEVGVQQFTQNPIQVTMNADYTVTPVFMAIPMVSLSISTTPGGTTNPIPGNYQYPLNTVVSITAIPDPSYVFDQWLQDGVAIGTVSPISIVMDSDKNIVASFKEVVLPPTQFAVIISVLGNGTTNPPPGSFIVDEGSSITIQAIPDQGYTFKEWQEASAPLSTENPITLVVTVNRSLVAVFEPIPPPVTYPLSIEATSGGTTAPEPGTYTVEAGKAFTIQAIPYSGWQFDHWEGSISGTSNPVTFQVLGEMSVVAVFTEGVPSFPGVLWALLPLWPWEGPPVPRFTGWTWDKILPETLPSIGGTKWQPLF